MVDIEFVGQLVDSMEDAIFRLEWASENGKVDEENKLRVFIFDLHKQIAEAIGDEGREIDDLHKNEKRVASKEKKKKKVRKRRKRSRRKNV
jgi:hypothetical protein